MGNNIRVSAGVLYTLGDLVCIWLYILHPDNRQFEWMPVQSTTRSCECSFDEKIERSDCRTIDQKDVEMIEFQTKHDAENQCGKNDVLSLYRMKWQTRNLVLNFLLSMFPALRKQACEQFIK